MENKEDPQKLIKKAEKLLKPGLLKSIFSRTEDRIEEAIELYNAAAQIYNIEKNYKKSAKYFLESAQLKININENPEEEYKEILNCYKKLNDNDNYNKILNELINNYLKKGEFSSAAKYEFEKGKNLSKDKNKIKETLESYEKALDYYNMDKDSSKIEISEVKIAKADLICLNEIKENLYEAHNIYDEIGNEKKEKSKILSYEFYTKNIISYLYFDDALSSKAYFHKYCENDSYFENSEIGKLINDLITIFENEENNIINENLTFDIALLNFSVNNKNKKLYDFWMEEMIEKLRKKLEKIRKEKPNFAEEEDFK